MTAAPLLAVRGLVKRFGGLTAVDGLDFALQPGEILALIGPNGAGKTTTFNLVAGVYRPDEGEIALDGESIAELAPHLTAARGVLRTFQHNAPFAGLSLVDNILVGRHTRLRTGIAWALLARRRSVEADAAARVAADALMDFVGLAPYRGAAVATLSFGAGRLLELARALAAEPRIILLDEPASGLTHAEMTQLAAVIRGVAARGTAVLLIEHDMNFLLPLAERVVVLDQGRKIADGGPHEIARDPAVIAAYLGGAAASRHVPC